MLSADWAWALRALLLLPVVLIQSGVSEPLPRIDGRWRSIATLRENVTREFSCQSEGWPAEAPPFLIWYLNGERQQTGGRVLVTSSSSPEQERGVSNQSSSHSTFTLRARKWDRELRCAAEHPASGETYNASVLLNVQFQPEIVRLIAHYSESSEPGLSLLLFALVHSNPPATVTFVDESGQQVTNTSDFLILDTRSYPQLTNHTLRVTLSSLPGNVSVSASNELGVTNSPLALTDLLLSRVEVPVLGIIVGGVLGFLSLVLLNLLVLCLVYKRGRRGAEKCVENKVPQSDSSQIKLDNVYLPRENMSLPSNLQLNDLSCLCKGRDVEGQKAAEEENHSEQEHSSGLATRGFARFPIVGYIYKVSSMSSDEVWL
ncbi:transmembrane protein 25 [Acipenser ruthenus]|uniref:transmembrane protein 25 n=1 Tax=Acipenser ruthenus TaxID=7906 RepID=UPI0027428D09|nr:transmembrane protein 25 [Acipenser ruthenus]XP_058866220.1 transmembrane protein 25 [Acipenser ruthenus]